MSQRLLLLLAVSVALLAVWQPVGPVNDFWMHVAFGRWIVQHAQVPRETLFLWSFHQPFVDHSWLSQVVFYSLMRSLGAVAGGTACVALTGVILLAALALSAWPLIRNGRISGGIALLLTAAVLLCVGRIDPRPEVFTNLFLVIVYRLLFLRRCAEHAKRPAWDCRLVLPLLIALWTNLHGAVIYGIVILWASAACDLAQYRADRESRHSLAIAALATAAMLLNPYGARYASIYLPVADSTLQHIQEWRPIWKTPPFSIAALCGVVAMTGCAVASWRLAGRRQWAQIAWIAISFGLFAYARRNIDLCVLTSLAVFAWNFERASASDRWRYWSARARSARLEVVAAVAASAWLVVVLAGTALGQVSVGGKVIVSRWMLIGQTAFLSRRDAAPEPALNAYETSSYLEWALGDRLPLYIDAMNAYPGSAFDAHAQMWAATPQGVALLDTLGIRTVIGCRTPDDACGPLDAYLAQSAQWRRVYDGRDGPVFVRQR